MKSNFHVLILIIVVIFPAAETFAQSNQTVTNGGNTAAVHFPVNGCPYTWVWTNDQPGIGLAGSGLGDIPSFTAINPGSTPIVATIKATPSAIAYLAETDLGDVEVMELATYTIVKKIIVGLEPFGVSISPDDTKVYVVNRRSRNVSVIDIATNTVVATIAVGLDPEYITVSPDGNRVYVSNTNLAYAPEGYSTVSVINTATNSVIATIPVGRGPSKIVVSPDSKKVYVQVLVDQLISVIDAASNSVTATIGTGKSSRALVISPDGSKLYLPYMNAGLDVYSTATNLLISSMSFGIHPQEADITSDGSVLYTTDISTGMVYAVNTSTFSLIASIPMVYPVSISHTKDGSKFYVTCGNNATPIVSVIDAATNTVSATAPIGHGDYTWGNFITQKAIGCSPVNFTINVNPTAPLITAGTVSGNISACQGAASAEPNIQQFSVSGNHISAGITATAPTGFEVSLTPANGYGSNITIPGPGGVVSNGTIYVRSSAIAPSGNISGNIVLSSGSAASQYIPVSAFITASGTPSVTITAAPGTHVCTGTVVTFTATPFNGGNSPLYQWQVNGVNTGGNAPSFAGNTFTNGDKVACVLTSNSVCATTPSGVSNTIAVIVTMPPPPVSISVQPDTSCSGTPVSFTASSSGVTGLSYQWLVNEKNTGGNSPYYSNSAFNDNDNIICIVTTTPACAAVTSNSIAVVILPSPSIQAGQSVSLAADESMTLHPIVSGDISDYLWQPGIGLSDYTAANPIANPEKTTNYELLVSATNGCKAKGTFLVSVSRPDFSIPNAFTPNGDGHNDFFYVSGGVNGSKIIEMSVFNRAGQQVFKTGNITPDAPAAGWDGNYKGRPAAQGAYVYLIKIQIPGGLQKLLKGSIILLR